MKTRGAVKTQLNRKDVYGYNIVHVSSRVNRPIEKEDEEIYWELIFVFLIVFTVGFTFFFYGSHEPTQKKTTGSSFDLEQFSVLGFAKRFFLSSMS